MISIWRDHCRLHGEPLAVVPTMEFRPLQAYLESNALPVVGGWEDVMVILASDQIDEDGLKVKACVERTLAEMSKPVDDLLTVVQEGDPSDPIVRIRTPHGDRSMRVARQLLSEQSEEWLCAQIRLRLEWMYRRPASVA